MPVLLTVVTDNPDKARLEQLEKIYADAQPERRTQIKGANSAPAFVSHILADPQQALYCGLFNERLIAAAVITKTGTFWDISHLCVRKITRRRGVGSRLLQLVLEAAQAENKALRVPADALMAQDLIILQRMGYPLKADGDTYLFEAP
ncbi:acetyl-CoA sensor PanZ family protein [Oceanospirillum maris]|jgi:ribosomal protein S18 acetylase RimI-like enzyme|uniref:acetyl-CoA sensor PanZ family protein n=1 Tax=Oceanospirillum maris TaxID=64977 RepID=UPI000408E791|nr:acetyl-CoA sensor PanZ family protein [Oceanospirillum maris]